MSDFGDVSTNAGSGGSPIPAIKVANPTTGNTDAFPVGAMAYYVGAGPVTGAMQAVDSTHGMPVQVVAALPAGTNVIGHFILDSGTVTADQGGAPWSFVGNVASGAADSGAPVKVGGVYNSVAPTFTTGERGDLQLDASGNIKAVLENASIAVTGTFWQATQPVSAASLPLPAGASTETTLAAASAKLPAALGQHAMTASMSVVIASDQSAVPVSGSVSISGTPNVAVTSLPATSFAGQTAVTIDYDTGAGVQNMTMIGFALPASGGSVAGGTSSNPIRIDPTGTTTQPISGTVSVSGTPNVNVTGLPATTNAGATAKTSDYDTGAGVDTVTMFGIALPASGGAVQGGTATNPIRTDPTGTTTQPISGSVTAAQGTGAALTGAWPVKVTDGATIMPTGASSANSIHTTLDNTSVAVTGTFWQNTQPVSLASLPALAAGTAVAGGFVPSASTGSAPVGATPFTQVSAANTTPVQIKASAGTLWDVIAMNVGTAPMYARFFDKATSPTMGADTPKYVLPLPSAGSANGGGASKSWPTGLAFTAGIWVSFTTGIALLDNTAGSASQSMLSGSYS